MDAPTESPEPPAVTAIRLSMGHWLAQAIHVACELRIPDILSDGPATVDSIADLTGANPNALGRLLRALAAHSVVGQREDGRFGPTALSEELRRDEPGALGSYVHWVTGSINGRAWVDLLHAVRSGETAFDHAFGAPFFAYLRQHPEEAQGFNRAMTAFTQRVAKELVEAYDFGRFRTIVDVGGGQGLLLATILRANPAPNGVLFDLPPVVAQAESILAREGVSGRIRIVGGDFFESIPQGGDSYVLKFVIHDWEDEHASRILSSCRAAMGEGSLVLVIERILPERVTATFPDQRASMMDLNMLALTGGQERTRAEFEALLGAAGFELTGVTETPSGIAVIEGQPR